MQPLPSFLESNSQSMCVAKRARTLSRGDIREWETHSLAAHFSEKKVHTTPRVQNPMTKSRKMLHAVIHKWHQFVHIHRTHQHSNICVRTIHSIQCTFPIRFWTLKQHMGLVLDTSTTVAHTILSLDSCPPTCLNFKPMRAESEPGEY